MSDEQDAVLISSLRRSYLFWKRLALMAFALLAVVLVYATALVRLQRENTLRCEERLQEVEQRQRWEERARFR